MTAPLLQANGLTKSFPGVRALKGVTLRLGAGEVVAVIGENGAGKSTLMKILAGVQTSDTGEIRLQGEPIVLRSVLDAQKAGIALIHQELNLADNLDIAANIFLGREHLRHGLIDESRLRREAQKHLRAVGLDIDPTTRVSELSIGHQQLIEIAKALSVSARILIMDEPTSSLSSGEAENLFRVIQELRQNGVSILYISHRLGEVKRLADRVVVLRDGENAGELDRSGISHTAMVKLMVGRDLSQFYAHTPHPAGRTLLKVQGLRNDAHPKSEVSFHVRAGELVGIAGLIGAGRTELLETLFGLRPIHAGTIEVDGTPIFPKSPLDAINSGLALVPEDRKRQGCILQMAVRQNVSLASLRRDQSSGFLNRIAEAGICREMIEALRIKTPGPEQIVQFLSGGNQQKVVLGKWLAMKPKVLLLDEPTRGIDVGAKHEVYRLMESLCQQGMAIVFVSSELEEILGLADRALVMHEGRIAGELARGELSEEAVMNLATDSAPGPTGHPSH